MKILQIFNGLCHWDATIKHPTLASTEGLYAPDILFVEAPDYVFEGWGYDPDCEGDDRFIKPTPPEGWAYDDATGTFYPTDPDIIGDIGQDEQTLAELVELYAEALETLGVDLNREDTDDE